MRNPDLKNYLPVKEYMDRPYLNFDFLQELGWEWAHFKIIRLREVMNYVADFEEPELRELFELKRQIELSRQELDLSDDRMDYLFTEYPHLHWLNEIPEDPRPTWMWEIRKRLREIEEQREKEIKNQTLFRRRNHNNGDVES
jgi:hypothetical protein